MNTVGHLKKAQVVECNQMLMRLLPVLARGMIQEVEHPICGPVKLITTPVKYSHSTPGIRSAPPTLGQHTDEILTDMVGMSVDEIARLRSEGVIS